MSCQSCILECPAEPPSFPLPPSPSLSPSLLPPPSFPLPLSLPILTVCSEILRVVDSLQLTAFKKVATPANWQVRDVPLLNTSTSLVLPHVYLVLTPHTCCLNYYNMLIMPWRLMDMALSVSCDVEHFT